MSRFVSDLYNEWIIMPHVLNKGIVGKWQEVPQIKTVCLSSTVKRLSNVTKILKSSVYLAELLCHQKPTIVRARKSVAAFKIRKGYAVGWRITVPKSQVGWFFYNLMLNVISRVKDFEGFFTLNATAFGCGTISVLPETDVQLARFNHNVGLYIECKFTGVDNKILHRFMLQHLNIPVYIKKK